MSTFCDGMKGEDSEKCGCILTTPLKSSTAHIHNIIHRCKKLPLQDTEIQIQNFIGQIGLQSCYNRCVAQWQLTGPLYEAYLRTTKPQHTTDDLIQLCKTLWSYTSRGIPSYPVNTLSLSYIQYYATFRTIISELKQFHDTYPLPPQEVANEHDEPQTIIIIMPNMADLLSQLKQLSV
jgi:hypothetical protein